jgi:excisionase family DNA binding protein
MTERDKVFTTFQAADYCQVSPFTIRNWIESGVLPAYKTPGGHRRVLKQDLDDFLKKHGMPAVKDMAPASKKILVVDDDKTVTDFVTTVISQLNGDIEIAVAHDGFEAGSLVTRFNPRVVILDLRMPGLDGFQVCERIKKDSATAKTTVLGITGFHSPEYEARFKACGGWKLLKKPLDVDMLIDTIEEALTVAERAARGSIKT